MSYGVGSQFAASPLDKSGGLVTYAIYAPQNAEKLEKAFREEIDRVLKDGYHRAGGRRRRRAATSRAGRSPALRTEASRGRSRRISS